MSHYWFLCKDAKTTQFTETKGNGSSMIVEIRSTGGYTAVPPSVHPSGEMLFWESERSPMEIDAETLYACVRDVALAALLAKHWNEFGHHAIGPLAGFLTMAGVVEAVRVIVTAAQVAGASSDIIRDARTYAETTVAKLRKGEKVTGGPTLAEHLPEALIDKMRGWCKMADVDAIEEMNAKHFWVRFGNKSAIGREDPDGVVFQNPKELYSEYANRQIVVGQDDKGKPQIKPLFQAWLESKSRRDYTKVVFCPPPLVEREGEYNLWRGFAVEPSREMFLAGKCLHMLGHIRHIICNNDPESYEYLMNLLARTVQAPGEPLGVAIVMRGLEGGGKGVFVEFLGSLFHRHHYAYITRLDQALGRFNKSIMGKVIVFLDEAAAEDALKNEGALKGFITEKYLMVEPKGVDTEQVRNHSHTFFATNSARTIPTSMSDRRLFHERVSDRYAFKTCPAAERKAYFDKLYAELNDPDARSGFLYFLQQRNLADFDRFDKVVTNEERNQQLKSLRGPMRWLFDVLASGSMPATIQGEVLVSAVYDSYVLWCSRHGEKPVGEGAWGKVCSKYLWTAPPRSTTSAGVPVRMGKLVSPDELRKRLPGIGEYKAEEVGLIVVNRNTGAPSEMTVVLENTEPDD
jgi:hypothetical protein